MAEREGGCLGDGRERERACVCVCESVCVCDREGEGGCLRRDLLGEELAHVQPEPDQVARWKVHLHHNKRCSLERLLTLKTRAFMGVFCDDAFQDVGVVGLADRGRAIVTSMTSI